MQWSVIRPKVLTVFGALVGIETYWRDRERAFVSPTNEATCLLHTTVAAGGAGWDDFRQEYNSGTNKLDLTQAGIRLFTVSVLVESYDQGDAKTALEYLEDLRDALQRPQVLADLLSINLAVRDVTATTDLSDTRDDHQVSIASMDVMFAFGNNKTSADGAGLVSLDWIEQVGGLGTDSSDVTPISGDFS